MKPIEIKILDALNQNNAKFKEIYFDDRPWQKRWTSILKKTLKTLGEELGCGVSASGSSGDEGEWLYDLVWWEMAENGKSIKSVPLVLESEISSMHWGAFKWDFEKLLVATSSTRVFITRDHKTSNQNEVLSKKKDFAKEAVQSFSAFNKGDAVHLIVWEEEKIRNGGPDGFTLKTFTKQ